MAAPTEITETVNVFNNSSLFSNHYLENMIQNVPEWDDDAHLREAYSQIKEIFDRKGKNFERYVEADLEHNWIRPVLDKLGHHYGVQEGLHHDPLKPDYAFFPDLETMEEAYSHKKGAENFYKKAVAVGDAKAWNVLLDKSRQGKAHREMTNPSFQIDVYLRATPPKWAILTNGRMWRLYHEDTSVKMDCYYEVNLPELINRIEESGDITLFKYFYLFFRLESFPQVPLGSSFLDRVREESAAYAQKIGKDLQENVYKAMKVLADGFFAEQSNSLSPSMEDIKDVQDNSMRLLYRLLFIFYAESRKLLNTDNKHYTEMSLRKLKEDISEKMDQGETLLAVRSTYWEGLKDLFRLINDGSEAFGYPKEEFYIPAYNGGLFDPTKNPFLAQKKIGNSYLAEAIDLLARSPGEKGMVFVDYSSLDIRHLGSIYEGILEYKLHLADEPMVVIKEKGKEVWLPKRDAANKTKLSYSVEAGHLYLVTDKGERKATGSFYTPEYTVKHLVKKTLAPLIDPMMEEAMWSPELRKDLLKKLLSIKVLDLAMGSGHFLVEATDYIAREIIHAKEIARHEDLESDDVAENDIHWARREVVRNCIYGVDLNPMAVELAKLSLWLTTVAANKPLSFLDHHLRCGNSLIGAEMAKLATLPGGEKEQTPLWNFVLKSHTDGLLSKYSLIAALPDDNLQMVKWKEDQFRQIKESELSRRLNELSNVWLSTFFGNNVSDDDYYELQNCLSPEKFPDWAGLREKEWFTRAQELAGEKRFFHWELEFPEAFQEEWRGFDVVIGNPPWIGHLTSDFEPIIGGKIFGPKDKVDTYLSFFDKALSLTKVGCYLGFITPNTYFNNRNALPLRKELATNHQLISIIDLPKNTFKDAPDVYPCITLIGGNSRRKSYSVGKGTTSTILPLVIQIPFDQIRAPQFYISVSQQDPRVDSVFCRLETHQPLLREYAKFQKGVETGDDVKYLRSLSEPEPGWYSWLHGREIEPYGINSDGWKVQYGPYLRNPQTPELITTPKIVIQYIRKLTLYPRIVAAFDNGEFFPSYGTLVSLIPNGKLHWGYLLTLLNSDLINRFYKHRFHDIAVKGGYLYGLPIRRISFTTPASERARLGAQLQQLYAEGKHAEILAQVETCLPKDEVGNFISEQEKSDVVHDLLAFLAERMLEMNKQKQKEIKGFLGWLEGYLGAKVDDLTPKTKLQSYYQHDYESFLAVLKKNGKKLAIDPARREPAEVLKAEFGGSLSKLSPLRERIRQTDELIDALVYKLYGLTEEEIKIVEGR